MIVQIARGYRAIVRYSEADVSYIADIPQLPGCSALGDTEVLAIEAIEEACAAWIASAIANGIPVPPPTGAA